MAAPSEAEDADAGLALDEGLREAEGSVTASLLGSVEQLLKDRSGLGEHVAGHIRRTWRGVKDNVPTMLHFPGHLQVRWLEDLEWRSVPN